MANRAATRHRRNFVQRNTAPLIFVAAGVILLITAAVLALTLGGDAPNRGTDFTLQSLDGETTSLADYRGTTVAVNFWATWCPPCRAEMPNLDQYYRDHLDQGFVLLAINVGESPALARSFVEQNGFSFPVLLDPDSRVADRLGVTGLPVTLVIDSDGNIAYRHSGLITLDVLDAQVLPLLGS